MRDDRMYDEDHSRAPMAAEVLGWIKANPGHEPTAVLAALRGEGLQRERDLRYALADMLDTGEIDYGKDGDRSYGLVACDEPRGRFM